MQLSYYIEVSLLFNITPKHSDASVPSWQQIKHSVCEEIGPLFSQEFTILYAPCIILQYAYKPTRCTKFLWLDFILQYTLYMFRIVSVHLQEQLFISCTSHLVYAGICWYVWLLCCYSNTTGIYQIRHTAYKKIAPEDGLIQSETCRAYIEK